MRPGGLLVVLGVLFVVASGAETAPKPKKPRLDVRASPKISFSPAQILFTAELSGGDDSEDLYCPEVEWDWDDGGKSVGESDCPPYEPGAKIERRYTAQHQFVRSGSYNVTVTLRRSGKKMLSSTVNVSVRPGVGEGMTPYN
jgi:hypothetical protein